MFLQSSDLKVYLALGYTDMRKAINGLSIIVEDLNLDPFSGHLFVFCNRRRKILKILYWDTNGFCLWQKRLEKDRIVKDIIVNDLEIGDDLKNCGNLIIYFPPSPKKTAFV